MILNPLSYPAGSLLSVSAEKPLQTANITIIISKRVFFFIVISSFGFLYDLKNIMLFHLPFILDILFEPYYFISEILGEISLPIVDSSNA